MYIYMRTEILHNIGFLYVIYTFTIVFITDSGSNLPLCSSGHAFEWDNYSKDVRLLYYTTAILMPSQLQASLYIFISSLNTLQEFLRFTLCVQHIYYKTVYRYVEIIKFLIHLHRPARSNTILATYALGWHNIIKNVKPTT